MPKLFHRHQLLILALLTGLLLALSWPARGLPFLAFVAFIPLLWLDELLIMRQKGGRPIQFFLFAWSGFFVFNLLTTWWIVYATIPGMIVAVILNAIFMTIPWWLMHISRRVLRGNQGPLSIVLFWLSFEYLHARWELSWSWLDLGNVFAANPAWIQWYEYTGTAGGSLWVLIINLMLFFAFKQYFQQKTVTKRMKGNFFLALAIFVIPSIISFHSWFAYEEETDPAEIVVIQPAEDPYAPVQGRADFHERVDRLIELANQKVTSETRFVVAPEGVNPRGIWMHEAESHYTVKQIRKHLSQYPDLIWVLGSFTYKMYDTDEEATPSARPYRNTNHYYDTFNSAIMIEAEREVQYYHKSKLVPGIERIPYFRLFKPLSGVISHFGGIAGSLGVQQNRSLFETGDGTKIAPAVCYESIYGDFMAGSIRQGAELVFIITNDGWWRDTPGYRQHNQYARLRAVEARKSIARSASTGISSFINQKGQVIKSTDWWEREAMSTSLNKHDENTFFVRRGNFLGRIALFVTVLYLLSILVQWIIYRKKPGL